MSVLGTGLYLAVLELLGMRMRMCMCMCCRWLLRPWNRPAGLLVVVRSSTSTLPAAGSEPFAVQSPAAPAHLLGPASLSSQLLTSSLLLWWQSSVHGCDKQQRLG